MNALCKIFVLVAGLYLIHFNCKAQDSLINLVEINGHGDCSSALSISTSYIIGPTAAPNGFGKIMEFSNELSSSKYYFENEHNTIWYKFKALHNGNLTFDIMPLSVNDDYDFILFKSTSDHFCNELITNRIIPVRSNLSRNDLTIASKTGLKYGVSTLYEDEGPGSSYSSALKVVKGELYYLVLDNVYENGKGHTIVFDYQRDDGSSISEKIIKDKIIDFSTSKGISADILLKDNETGKVIASAKSDSTTGEFKLIVPKDADLFKQYVVSISSPGYFFNDQKISLINSINQTSSVAIKLQKLVAGKSYNVSTIYFYSNSPQYLPESEVALKNLLKMMQDNPKMEIEIAGHINGCIGPQETMMKLSRARALTVKNYLIDHGISADRMTYEGFGCTKMIYPIPKTEEESQMNRRVEIVILKL